MKKWNVKYAKVGCPINEECVRAETYTTAYIAFSLKHSDDEHIVELTEVEE